MITFNFYSHLDEKHKVIKTDYHEKTVAEIFPNEDFENALILVAGRRKDKDYIPRDKDIVFIRKTPSAPVQTVALIVSAVVAVVAGVIGGVAMYKAKAAQEEAEDAMKRLSSANNTKSIDSTAIDTLPFLKGANNQGASGRSFPYFIGRSYFSPYRLAPKWFEIPATDNVHGKNQYCNMLLEAGFKGTAIESIKLGNNEIYASVNKTAEDYLGNFKDDSTYYSDENKIEIRNGSGFVESFCKKKIISKFLNTEINFPYTDSLLPYDERDYELVYDENGNVVNCGAPVVIQAEENCKAVDICLLADGLRKWDNGWKDQTIDLRIFWSNLASPRINNLADWNEITATNERFQQNVWDGYSYTKHHNYYKLNLSANTLYQGVIAEINSALRTYYTKVFDACMKNAYVPGFEGDLSIPGYKKVNSSVVKYWFNQIVNIDDLSRAMKSYIIQKLAAYPSLWELDTTKDNEYPEFDLQNIDASQFENIEIIYGSSGWDGQSIIPGLHEFGLGGWTTWEYNYIQERKNLVAKSSNSFTYCSDQQMRFMAHKDFTASEAFQKSISFMILRTSPKAQSNSNDSIYVNFLNTEVYDPVKSTNDNLVTCLPIEEEASVKCCVLGMKMKADENSENLTDSINIVASGTARTWNGENWSIAKTVTSNPASWALEVLTSDVHNHSKYSDDELDLSSFGAFYEYCETEGFTVGGVITEDKTKESIIDDILSVCGASLIRNADGLFEIVIDKAEENSVALLNCEDIQNFTVVKDFSKKSDGYKVTFTNKNTWSKETLYLMKDGTSNHTASDVITEIAPTLITDLIHAQKYAHRLLAMQNAQPRTVEVTVGKECAYYPLYSCVELQLPQLKIGMTSSVIRSTTVVNEKITKLVIADMVTFEADKQYGIIVQAVTKTGSSLQTLKLTTDAGKTNTLILQNSIDIDTVEIGNILSVGELSEDGTFEKVTTKMKIYGIEPADNGYKLTLKDYNAGIYSCVTEDLPLYQTNITEYQRTSPASIQYTNAEIRENMDDLRELTMGQISELYNTNTVTLYKECTNKPSAVTFNAKAVYSFSTGKLYDENKVVWDNSTENDGWKTVYPKNATNTVYMATAVAFGKEAEDSIEVNEWAEPIPGGLNGADGYNSRVISLYIRSETTPSTLPDECIYYFDEREHPIQFNTSSNGWKTSIPSVDTDGDVWEIHAMALSTAEFDTIEPSQWSSPTKIAMNNGLSREDVISIVDSKINQTIETPNIWAEVTYGGFAVDVSGYTTKAQSIDIKCHCVQTHEELEFEFDLTNIALALPEGFRVSVSDYHTLRISCDINTKIPASGNIPIIIKYYPFETNYGIGWYDDNGNIAAFVVAYNDDDSDYRTVTSVDDLSNVLGDKVYSQTAETYTIGFGFATVTGGEYFNGINKLADIPTDNLIIGDYFTWTGTTTESSLSKDNYFRTGVVYQYCGEGLGYKWEKDESKVRLMSSLTDVLSGLTTELEGNNSGAVQYLDKLTSNEIFANRIVTNTLLSDSVIANFVQSNKVATALLEADSAFVTELTTNTLTVDKILDPDGDSIYDSTTKTLRADLIKGATGVFDEITSNNGTFNKANIVDCKITGEIEVTKGISFNNTYDFENWDGISFASLWNNFIYEGKKNYNCYGRVQLQQSGDGQNIVHVFDVNVIRRFEKSSNQNYRSIKLHGTYCGILNGLYSTGFSGWTPISMSGAINLIEKTDGSMQIQFNRAVDTVATFFEKVILVNITY